MIIFRYLNQQILSSFFATTLVLLVIFLSNQLVHTLNDAASGRLTIHAVLMLTAVQLPILLAYMIPIGLFLAILLSLGRLYVNHEMVVLSACGVSKSQIVAIVMGLAFVITLFDGWLMLSAQPYLSRVRGEILVQSAQTATLDKLLPGRFQEIGDDTRVIYAGAVNKSENYFGDILVAIRDKPHQHQAPSWTILSSASVGDGEKPQNGKFFVFKNGYRYLATPGNNDLKVLKFDAFWQRLPGTNIKDHGRYSAMQTAELVQRYSKDPHAASELQWRVVNVLSTLLFALLAIPLSEVNPRKGRFAQMLPAIFVYIAYANMMFAAKSWIKNQTIPAFIGMWWIVVLLLLLALVLLWGKRGWQRLWRRRQHAHS